MRHAKADQVAAHVEEAMDAIAEALRDLDVASGFEFQASPIKGWHDAWSVHPVEISERSWSLCLWESTGGWRLDVLDADFPMLWDKSAAFGTSLDVSVARRLWPRAFGEDQRSPVCSRP